MWSSYSKSAIQFHSYARTQLMCMYNHHYHKYANNRYCQYFYRAIIYTHTHIMSYTHMQGSHIVPTNICCTMPGWTNKPQSTQERLKPNQSALMWVNTATTETHSTQIRQNVHGSCAIAAALPDSHHAVIQHRIPY